MNDLPYHKLQPHKIGHLLNGTVVVQNGLLNIHDEITSQVENMILDDDSPAGEFRVKHLVIKSCKLKSLRRK